MQAAWRSSGASRRAPAPRSRQIRIGRILALPLVIGLPRPFIHLSRYGVLEDVGIVADAGDLPGHSAYRSSEMVASFGRASGVASACLAAQTRMVSVVEFSR